MEVNETTVVPEVAAEVGPVEQNPAKIPPVPSNKLCVDCKEPFSTHFRASKWCPDCKRKKNPSHPPRKEKKVYTLEEKRAYARTAKAKSRKHQAAKAEVAASKPTSTLELTEKEAKGHLSDSGLSENVVNTCVRFGAATANIQDVPANKHFWTPETDNAEEVSGEVLRRFELEALYKYCAQGREILGSQPAFDEWLQLRFRAKTDLWFLCVDIAKKGLVEKTHRDLVSAFVRKDPTLLKPDYDQEGMKSALLKQDVCHDRLILYPRSFYKSTINVLDVLQWLFVFPDLRCIVITSASDLSTAFVGELKSYLVVRSLAKPTALQCLFPEYTLKEEGTSDTLYCPAAVLGLKDPSVWASAIGSDSVGFHCDLQVFDDAVSAINANTPDFRDRITARVDVIGELLDRPWGFCQTLGTRYAGGETPDLYGRMLQRNEASEEKDLKVLVKGSWTVLPHASHKKIKDLLEFDVDLLFPLGPNGEPGKGSWSVLQKKLRANERNFRQQQLNEAIDDDVENLVTFSEGALRQACRPPDAFPEAERIYRILSLDAATSTSKYADYSCCLVADVLRIKQDNGIGKNIFFVVGCRLERMKTSNVAVMVNEMVEIYKPDRAVCERTSDWEALAESIRNTSVIRGTSLPSWYWKASPNTPGFKAARIKHSMEPLLNEKRLFFSTGIANLEECIQQTLKFDGIHRSNNTRKDDFPDAASLGISVFMPFSSAPVDENLVELEVQAQAQKMLKAQHEMYFGVPSTQYNPQPTYTPPADDVNPLYGALSRFGMVRK